MLFRGLTPRGLEEGRAEVLTSEYAIGGTPSYMAPEMARGDAANIGPRSDVYLLGAVLFEMATGKKPHQGKDVLSCLVNAANNVIADPETDGKWLEISMQAMATDPQERFSSVKEFQDVLGRKQGWAQLEVIESPRMEPGTLIDLTDFNAIGRSKMSGCNIVIPDPAMARIPHVLIRLRRFEPALYIHTLLTDSPARVNGEVVDEVGGRKLNDGDVITFGMTRLRFLDRLAEPETAKHVR